MSVKLFGTRLSPFVEKTARALDIKGIEYRLVPPKGPQDFKKWNPTTGKMPVLVLDNDRRVHDSSRILRELDKMIAEPALFSSDPTVAAKQSFVEDWSDESLYWYCMAIRWSPENESATVAQLAGMLPFFVRPLAGLIFPRLIGGTARAQGLAREPLPVLTEELGKRFDEVLAFLGDRPFLFSERVSAADLAIFGQCRTMQSGPTPQCVDLIEERPAMVAYLHRVDRASRPRDTKAARKLHAA